jgi:hypothetical protein
MMEDVMQTETITSRQLICTGIAFMVLGMIIAIAYNFGGGLVAGAGTAFFSIGVVGYRIVK